MMWQQFKAGISKLIFVNHHYTICTELLVGMFLFLQNVSPFNQAQPNYIIEQVLAPELNTCIS